MSKYTEIKHWLSRIDAQGGQIWLKVVPNPKDPRESNVHLMATLTRIERDYTLCEFARDPVSLFAEAKGEAVTVGFPHVSTPYTLLVYALSVAKYTRPLEEKLSIVFY